MWVGELERSGEGDGEIIVTFPHNTIRKSLQLITSDTTHRAFRLERAILNLSCSSFPPPPPSLSALLDTYRLQGSSPLLCWRKGGRKGRKGGGEKEDGRYEGQLIE